MAATNMFLTPVNKITREKLSILITNNIMNESLEFMSDNEKMETDSPIRKPNLQPVSKKLFHSPMPERSNEGVFTGRSAERRRKTKKRKHSLIPDSCEKIKKAYVTECEKDAYSTDARAGMRQKVLISLFHNKEYSMEMDFGS